MACEHWNDDWVAELYGELEPAERDRLQRHAAGCASCRDTLAELAASRATLRAHAPAVPAGPRVIAIPPGATRRGRFATFAAGMAAALVLFVAGVLAAPALRPASGAAAGGVTPEFVEAAVADALAEQRRAFEVELATLRAPGSDPRTEGAADEAGVSSRQLETALAGLERRINVSRAADVEFLLGELEATEARAAAWFDDNREALMLVAMRNDPRFSER